MRYILPNIITIILIAIAAYLAINGIKGWGWFLFVALLCGSSVTTKYVTTKRKNKK